MNLLNIEVIRKYVEKKNILWTKHCLNRINQRDILILGRDNGNKDIHIVCGICEEYIYMITAYHPNIDKWENDMKTRREDNELFYV